MNDQDPVLQRLAVLAASDANIDVLWLYGSRTKNRQHATSDYDLAVAYAHSPSDVLERRLQPELLAMEWSDALGLATEKISVIDIAQVPLPLALSVIESDCVLHVRNRLRLAREENRITSMWELDHQYHRKHYG